MRRRRLIGIYRGLRKSIYAVALIHWTPRHRPDGPTRRASDPARPFRRTYPIVPASTIAAHFAADAALWTPCPPLIWPFSRDMQGKARAPAAGPSVYSHEAFTMTTFDKREEGFEKQFAHDEELKFRAMARRNKMLGYWAAEKLGLTGPEAEAYAKDVVLSDFEEAGDHDVFRKVRKDFDAKGVTQSDHQIRRTMDEFLEQAAAQIKAGRWRGARAG